MLKITNRDTGSKRIRLTALDSAMSNIDDSTGAVAKDGKDPTSLFTDFLIFSKYHWNLSTELLLK